MRTLAFLGKGTAVLALGLLVGCGSSDDNTLFGGSTTGSTSTTKHDAGAGGGGATKCAADADCVGAAAGATCCDGACTDPKTDADHCGACGKACAKGTACKAGACTGECAAGHADCNGKPADGCEVSTDDDPAHCGACDVVCGGDHVAKPACEKGVCAGACEQGFADCDADKKTNGCETDVGTDPTHCGGCKTACSGDHVPTPTCTSAVCTGSCEEGWSDCDGDKRTNGCESQTATDPANCGGCGTPCAGDHVEGSACEEGQCAGACEKGWFDCDFDLRTNGCEVAPATDPANCGGCGQPCSNANVTPACTGGTCSGACDEGFADCNFDKRSDGCETEVGTNAASCGGCGVICSTNHVPAPACHGGKCDGACAAGFFDCDGDKQANGCEANIASDPDNCGGCGVVCSGNGVLQRVCINSTCVGTCAPGFADCDGDKQKNGCESVVDADPTNCGACGKVCSQNHVANPTCSGGFCTGACDPGTLDCDGDRQKNGCETEAASDVANCGGCGLACSAANVVSVTCQAGACTGACKAGFADCDNNRQSNGCETNVEANVQACGGCGKACSSNHVAVPSCSAGVCNGACAAGWTDCDGNKQANGCESNVAADPNNCGGCGVVCSSQGIGAQACTNGACAGTCSSGFADCDGNKQSNGCETNVWGDAKNCGGCGVTCSQAHVPNPTCGVGVCNGSCEAGFADCDGNKLTNGCESPIGSDVANCGGCGLVCSANHIASVTCTSGACNGACVAGFADCDGNKQTNGCEADLVNGATSCGGCGVVCSSNHVVAATCSAGTCTSTCAAGWTDCDKNKQTNGCEVNTLTDPDNCGGCGIVCSANGMGSRTCSNGVCTGACAAGYTDCDGNKQSNGCETNTGADASNCGACGKVCSSGHIASPTCGGGVCNGACDAGYADCDGNKQTNGCETNVDSNVASCGACGKSCSANHVAAPVCAGGACVGACDSGYADCDGNKQTNGCEVSLGTDVNNCGTCKTVCSSNHVSALACSAGVCTSTCVAGWADCDGNKQTNGCEQDVYGSATNCGACKVTCSANNVPVPACTGGVCTGTCAAGTANCDGNKQTNGCETFSSVDPQNCGGCNIVCSSNHVDQVQCTGSVCNGPCASGWSDCNANKQSDGCESDPQTDANNCGACGLACSNTNMATRTCAAATCNGTCKAGYADCDGNKLSNGCEINTNTDAANCGNCGNACPNGQTCSNGTCQTCNATALLLGDSVNANNTYLKNQLVAAGLTTTQIDNGVTTYANSPVATNFGVVIVLVGSGYSPTMPVGGQSGIVTAQAAGAGVIFTEWASYAYTNYWTTLKTLPLLSYLSNTTGTPTYTLTSPNHPVWTGLPNQFTVNSSIYVSSGTLINGGTSISSATVGSGVAVKNPALPAGRIVHLPVVANYSTNWINDPNLVKLFVNGARWAARCQ